jgi:predicted helicase
MPLTSEYLKKIERALAAGNATEHTYRRALQSFIESFQSEIVAVNEPRRVASGAPDLLVTLRETPLGYVETRNIGTSLNREEKSEQMARYLEGLGNLVLTDYLEFRWYVKGERRLTARLASKTRAGNLRVEEDGAEASEELLSAFLEAQAATVGSAKELAVRMARIARLIRGNILRALAAEGAGKRKAGPLRDQLASFREVLLHDLTEEQFADMYAQTICYGLFAARCNAPDTAGFTRDGAAGLIRKTNPFLQKTFYRMVGPDLSPHVAWAVDDLVALLAHTNIGGILLDFGRRTRREDPVVHFYETFLAEYDPRLRETRGVYYTPEPVVSYIVRSVDYILKNDFKLADGLADAGKIRVPARRGKGEIETHKVLILDPATGTGTFLYSAINLIYQSVGERAKGAWPAYVAQELLPRLLGFELLLAPYTVAHLKLGLLLEETGYDFQGGERLSVYLTDTLAEAFKVNTQLLFAQWVADEANAAAKIEREAPVMVVFGNPPYSGISTNMSEDIARMVDEYKTVDGQPLGERKHWLQDDYVKFIRFAQERIERTGYGILAFVTNHGYLDNPTFRGMRQSLMRTFEDIYVLDLHGNSKKKESAPDGSKDENVFDIQQGVAIGIFVKHASSKAVTAENATANVQHADLWGVRETYGANTDGERELTGGKYQWLSRNDLSTTEWTKLKPQTPFYLFTPQDTLLSSEYESNPSITQCFDKGSNGIQTSRDNVAYGFTSNELKGIIERFRAKESVVSDLSLREKFWPSKTVRDYPPGDTRGWKLPTARTALREDKDRLKRFKRAAYRPFDYRDIFYAKYMIDWPRLEIMSQLLQPNLSLCVGRAGHVVGGNTWDLVFVSNCPVDMNLFYRGGNVNYPLYIYPSGETSTLFDDISSDARRPNLSEGFIKDFSARLLMSFVADGRGDRVLTFGAEDVFAYMYAVFHSPTYRSRYAEFLKIDFPRLPLTSDAELFAALCEIGDSLLAVHLLENFPSPATTYPVAGTNEVEQVGYTEPGEDEPAGGRVWINGEQFFAGVPEEVWNFHIGGYQVASKWLKDRKGRTLTYEDITHYRNVVAALGETLRLMSAIDAEIEQRAGWPLE